MCVAFDAFAITSFVFIACAKSSVVTSHLKVKQVESSYFTIWSSRVESSQWFLSSRLESESMIRLFTTLEKSASSLTPVNTGYSNEPPLFV